MAFMPAKIDLPNQPFYAIGLHDCRAVSLPVEDRIIFQMDQAASPDQGVLWDFGKCRKDPDLDSYQRLCLGRHR
jgi:hypothetical protein